MSDFLSSHNEIRKKIKNVISAFTKEEYDEIIKQYDDIISEWEKELKSDINNHLFEEEYCL